MQNNLLPCPFCGGEAGVMGYDNGFNAWFQVVCKSCGVSQTGSNNWTENIAIEHWNTRKAMERIVEQLEELENITLDQYNNSMARTYEHDFADGKECGVSMALDIVRNGGKE